MHSLWQDIFLYIQKIIFKGTWKIKKEEINGKISFANPTHVTKDMS